MIYDSELTIQNIYGNIAMSYSQGVYGALISPNMIPSFISGIYSKITNKNSDIKKPTVVDSLSLLCGAYIGIKIMSSLFDNSLENPEWFVFPVITNTISGLFEGSKLGYFVYQKYQKYKSDLFVSSLKREIEEGKSECSREECLTYFVEECMTPLVYQKYQDYKYELFLNSLKREIEEGKSELSLEDYMRYFIYTNFN